MNYITSAVLLDVSSILLQNHDLSALKSVVFSSMIIVIGKVNLKNRKWQWYCYQRIITCLPNIINRNSTLRIILFSWNKLYYFHTVYIMYKLTSEKRKKKPHCDLINQYLKKILFSFCSIYTAYGIMNNIWINIYI